MGRNLFWHMFVFRYGFYASGEACIVDSPLLNPENEANGELLYYKLFS